MTHTTAPRDAEHVVRAPGRLPEYTGPRPKPEPPPGPETDAATGFAAWSDTRLCNCCHCGAVLLGDGEAPGPGLPPAVYLRHRGRPWCRGCWRTPRRRPEAGAGVPDPGHRTDGNPWQENGIRAMEGE